MCHHQERDSFAINLLGSNRAKVASAGCGVVGVSEGRAGNCSTWLCRVFSYCVKTSCHLRQYDRLEFSSAKRQMLLHTPVCTPVSDAICSDAMTEYETVFETEYRFQPYLFQAVEPSWRGLIQHEMFE